jgi:hypothetical protein
MIPDRGFQVFGISNLAIIISQRSSGTPGQLQRSKTRSAERRLAG